MAQCTVSQPVAKKQKRKPSGLIIPSGPPEPVERPPTQTVQRVLPNLFISGYAATRDLLGLQSLNLTHVLNLVGEQKCPPTFPHIFEYEFLAMPDNSRVDITFFVYAALEVVERVIESGGKVLIHCVQGISRAPTIACAYLMWKHNLTLDSALDCIRSAHPDADPNMGFLSQLVRLRDGDSIDVTYTFSDRYRVFMPSVDPSDCQITRKDGVVYVNCAEGCDEEGRKRVQAAVRCIAKFEPRARVVESVSVTTA